MSIFDARYNIFNTLKLDNPTLNMITLQQVSIDILDQFPLDTEQYMSIILDVHEEKEQLNFYVSFKIESIKTVNDLKQGNKSVNGKHIRYFSKQ